ncbi:MAG: hypothetical protein JRH20_22670 [Deltaproteobacteria bacterium]|nr:hypothetical protein [Deltaproteobacteria bacterium]
MRYLVHHPIHFFCGALIALAFGACSDDTTPVDARVVDATVDVGTLTDTTVTPSDGPSKQDGTQTHDTLHQDSGGESKGLLADHTASGAFSSISTAALGAARAKFGKIFYGHTSHGGQIVSGLNMLETEDGTKYAMPTLVEYDGDLGHDGDTAWVTATKNALSAADHGIKMVVWSWCGGASDNTTAGINTYLTEMNALEQAYPDIVFVYMTGHLDGTGPTGPLYTSNNQIRTYCKDHSKVLFDFADIESYDPDGTYYPDEDDSCQWCSTWCSTHSCPSCNDCAHSHCFNCLSE